MEEKQLGELAIAEQTGLRTFTLENNRGTRMKIAEIGAAVMSLIVIDDLGKESDIVLGYDRAEDYLQDEYYIGTVVGRYANRIGGGRVSIDGEDYHLSTEGKQFHHHGGTEGFNKKQFTGSLFHGKGYSGVNLRYTSADGEEGYPGEFQLEVKYTLTDANEWIVEYKGVSDKPTIVNLTQHAYFNLSGNGSATIDDHEFQIEAEWFLPVNEEQLPTGQLSSVKSTPFDFIKPRKLDMHLWQHDLQLRLSYGFDHSFVLEKKHTPTMKSAARVVHPASGRTLEVLTTEPSVHLYAGNFLDNVKGKDGITYHQRAGFCLETQHFPDAPNHPHFPGTEIGAGEEYYSKTVFRVG